MTVAQLPSGSPPAADAVVVRTVLPTGVHTIVWLGGEQDASTAAGLTGSLASAIAVGEGDVVVDLSAVRFMDAAIVTVLVTCKKLLSVQSRRLTLRAPSRNAQRILDLCGLVELLEPDPAILAGGLG
jgi:anti-anti-sigma factor